MVAVLLMMPKKTASLPKISPSNSPILPTVTLTSPAFTANAMIPVLYSCQGQNINPPLDIGNVPSNTKSLLLTITDPDAPRGTFTHWILYNIPTATQHINANTVPADALQGTNSTGQKKYMGPCPPTGTHHYIFDIFALDTLLSVNDLNAAAIPQQVLPHVIARGELIGLFHQ